MKRSALLVTVLALLMAMTGIVQSASAQREQLPPWRQPLPPARTTAEMTVGETVVPVELALNSDEQSLGLGYRNSLEPDSGMLFVFGDPSERVFWMKGMRFCLDIIWIADDQIVGAAENACPDPDGTPDGQRARFPSETPVTHVLEMNAGWLAAHGYGPGTTVEFPEGLG